MKKHLRVLSILLFYSASIFSQVKPIPDTLVLFGMDFSLAKIITKNNYTPQDVINNDIPKLNAEMIKIGKQYTERFWAKQLVIDTTDVHRINSQIKADGLFTETHFQFSGGDTIVRQELQSYTSTKHTNGVGLLLVMEKVDEIDNRESFYLLLFDLRTKKVIHCDKVETGLSRVKNAFESGWFSWKTGIFKVISSMSDVYDFWNSYPVTEKIDIRAKAPELIKNDTLHPVKVEVDSMYGVKGRKLIMLSGAIALLGDDIKDEYPAAFSTKYRAANIYGVTGSTSLPKTNLYFEYGLSRKNALGLSLSYDKCSVTWSDTVNATANYTDTWSRYQIALSWNYYLVAMPVFNLYMGAQFGYNLYHESSTAPAAIYPGAIHPLPITIQLHIGMACFIKKKIGIHIGGGFGLGAADYFTLGVSRKF